MLYNMFIPCVMSEHLISLSTRPDEMEQDYMIPACPPPSMFSACLLPVENFSQRINLIREMKNAEAKENSLRRLNNNNIVIKHSQGPLVVSQRL